MISALGLCISLFQGACVFYLITMSTQKPCYRPYPARGPTSHRFMWVVSPRPQRAGANTRVRSTARTGDAVSLPSACSPSPTSVVMLSELAFIIYTIQYLTMNQAVLSPQPAGL